MSSVSANYRKLSLAEAERVAEDYAKAWTHPIIPERQLELVTRELEWFRAGQVVAPFDALLKCLRKLPLGFLMSHSSLLDVGASGGYYSEVIARSGFKFDYQAVDYSRAFKQLAETLYPEIEFDVADARQLPYADNQFDIVLNGAVIMHVSEYEKVIAETARVAKKYAIFHRTPIVIDRPAEYFEKEAYGVRCLEIHFNERELLDLFAKHGLTLFHSQNIFWNPQDGMGHWTYLTSKVAVEPEPYSSNKNV